MCPSACLWLKACVCSAPSPQGRRGSDVPPWDVPLSAARWGPGRCSRCGRWSGSWGPCSPCWCPGPRSASPPPACSDSRSRCPAGRGPRSCRRAGSEGEREGNLSGGGESTWSKSTGHLIYSKESAVMDYGFGLTWIRAGRIWDVTQLNKWFEQHGNQHQWRREGHTHEWSLTTLLSAQCSGRSTALHNHMFNV